MTLSNALFSCDHAALLAQLASGPEFLIIQDLDGVCMGLVRDPLERVIDPAYLYAARRLSGRFEVLTNGEHIGRRGVNGIVERALRPEVNPAIEALYLPGLAGGGVQLQDARGQVRHPGVSEAELAFLAEVPDRARSFLHERLSQAPYGFNGPELDALLDASILDNLVSPTVNLNYLHHALEDRHAAYRQLQDEVMQLMDRLLADARDRGLADSFFVHLAPNLGRDAAGVERLKPGDAASAGTHDFQLMLRGAVKEVGVLVILNQYYARRTGRFPFGEDFNARNAPRDPQALLDLAQRHLDPALMPRLVGVGDTVTAVRDAENPQRVHRGGSDRAFLNLIQDLGRRFDSDNVVVLIDSSGGEVKRPGLDADVLVSSQSVRHPAARCEMPGISDSEDPLQINVAFPGGHEQYVPFYIALSERVSTL